jgi:hypothetical protein
MEEKPEVKARGMKTVALLVVSYLFIVGAAFFAFAF